MSITLLLSLATNLVLSAIAGSMAKQWGITHVSSWLVGAVLANACGFMALAWAIRSTGLGLGTSLALLLTILLNTGIGVFIFNETLSTFQMTGIAAAVGSIALMVFG